MSKGRCTCALLGLPYLSNAMDALCQPVCLSVHMLNLTHCLWTKAVRWKYMEIVSLGVDTNRYRYTLRSHYTASEEDTLWSCVAPLQLELPAPESRCHRFVQQLLVLFINRKYDIFICVHTHMYILLRHLYIKMHMHIHTTSSHWHPTCGQQLFFLHPQRRSFIPNVQDCFSTPWRMLSLKTEVYTSFVFLKLKQFDL